MAVSLDGTILDWDYFFKQLDAGMNIDETGFYFSDDPMECEHYLGYIQDSYWIGYCDIEDGCDFSSAAELVNAPVFDGKSFQERWDNVVICSIEGIGVEDWLKFMSHV